MPTRRLAQMIGLVGLLSCGGERPANLGISDGELAPCPPTPNCVSSDATGQTHAVEALVLVGTPEAWPTIRDAVEELPRTSVIEETDGYLHAECRSAVFGFVDDLELHLRPGDGVVAVRSASRVGRGDLGVNRRRVEELRALLRARGVVD